VLVADACDTSYSGSRDQEDHGLNKQFERSYLEKILHKKGLVEWLKE
jgi:hypothetical protein